jgi:hypothetical protein
VSLTHSRVTTATLAPSCTPTQIREVGQDQPLRSVLNPDDLGLVLPLCVVLVQGLESETLSGERGVRPSLLEIIEQHMARLTLHPPLQALLDGRTETRPGTSFFESQPRGIINTGSKVHRRPLHKTDDRYISMRTYSYHPLPSPAIPPAARLAGYLYDYLINEFPLSNFGYK